MCYTEDVFHAPCRHWGSTRITGSPCPRSRVVNGHDVGCGRHVNHGSVNSKEYCGACRDRVPGKGRWELSLEGWANLALRDGKMESESPKRK
ncbi:hypothetical protein EJ04DRAFT_217969 [Polyplosphaeria fusca]|uniref:Uncharacterized protein n=1 Tax=Polyplosphaeria fusca TaxID=682080 RepID=A0A9P4V3H0_9PLEO|nr:hypothetical protein EJ04DRAFT_217969 [Polyplosphaeria fusca]